MALSRLLFMAARIVASNPRLRKEVQKAAEASYTKAKPLSLIHISEPTRP